MKDPKKLKKQRPDYVRDTSGTGGQDRPSIVGTDPESPPRSGERDIPAPKTRKEDKSGRDGSAQ